MIDLFLSLLANKAAIIHEVDLTIRNNTYCQEVMDNLAIFSEEKDEFHSDGLFCAGGEKGIDACEGDSGSAIFIKQKRKGFPRLPKAPSLPKQSPRFIMVSAMPPQGLPSAS